MNKTFCKANITGRRFLCIDNIEDDDDSIGNWSEMFKPGETYLELKTDSDNQNLAKGVDDCLLLQGEGGFTVYVDAKKFVAVVDTNQIVKSMWIFLN